MFPQITNIDQILKAIFGSEEFIVKRDVENSLLIVNYVYNTPITFPDPNSFETESEKLIAKLRRECRGIEFDLESGDLVTRPYHKFFNISEKPETQPDKIDWKKQHWVLEKLDGSMIKATIRNGKIQYHTKMGLTDIAIPVNDFVKNSPLLYEDFSHVVLESNCSPLFEWCSRKQRIVIDYPEDKLTLTAIRNNKTGDYILYPDMCKLAAKYGIPVVHAWDSVDNIDEFLNHAANLKDAEGYVIRFADGSHYKIKGQWYCLIHGIKDALASEKNVWSMILEETIDDSKTFMDDADRAAVDAFTAEFGKAIEQTACRLRNSVDAHRRSCQTKKDFALSITKNADIPSLERSMMFSIWDGAEPTSTILKVLKNNTGSSTKIEAVRDLAGGIRWDRFYKNILED